MFFLTFEILFSDKNIFRFINNINTITEKETILLNKKKELNNLVEYLKNFENVKQFRKLVIKDKLFYKEKEEKVILYNLSF